MLQQYLTRFASLRVDRVGTRWTATTTHRAPHKAIMLLAVIDCIASGAIDENLITLSDELIATYRALWCVVFGQEPTTAQVVMPFYRLKADGFWHLIPKQNEEQMREDVRRLDSSKPMFDALYLGVWLDDALFEAIQSLETDSRFKLVQSLVYTYFDESTQLKLRSLPS